MCPQIVANKLSSWNLVLISVKFIVNNKVFQMQQIRLWNDDAAKSLFAMSILR